MSSDHEMRDSAMKRDVLKVLKQYPEGIDFGEFAGIFYQIHGRQFELWEYDRTSLQEVMEDLEDFVELDWDYQPPVVRPKPKRTAGCQDHKMRDSAMKRDILKVVKQYPEGIDFGEFAGVFYQIHGRQFELWEYDRESLQEVMEDLKDFVEVDCDFQPPVVKPKPKRTGSCQDHKLKNSAMKRDILKVVNQYPDGIDFGEFAGVFHQIHDRQLKLWEYGQTSLQNVMEDLKDFVEVDYDYQPPLAKPRPKKTGGCQGQQMTNADLREDILKVVLQHSKGIDFGEFAGAFHQIHGKQLELSTYGYTSLKEMLEDMTDVVKVNWNCQPPLVKPQLRTAKKEQAHRTQMSAESKPQNQNQDLKGAKPKQNVCQNEPLGSDNPIVNWELKEGILNVVLQHPKGIGFGEFAGTFHQINGKQLELSKYGYTSLKNMLQDLTDLVKIDSDHQPPLIRPQLKTTGGDQVSRTKKSEPQNQSHLQEGAQAKQDAPQNRPQRPAPQVPQKLVLALTDILVRFPIGLKMKNLVKEFKKVHELDPEDLARILGYSDLRTLLQQLPGVLLYGENKMENCKVQLQEDVISNSARSRSPDSEFKRNCSSPQGKTSAS